MKTLRTIAAALLIAGSALTLNAASAQQWGGIKRTDLLQNNLSIPGREVVQSLVEIPPGVTAPRHAHPGEEIAYVVEGTLEYTLDGRPPMTLKAGEALFIPNGTPHSAKNVGTGKAVELATYIVAKGKPLVAQSK
jgi:quercetin dioxygenase-like cupin family protein